MQNEKWQKEADLREEKQGEDKFSNFLETFFSSGDSFTPSLYVTCWIICVILEKKKHEQVGVHRKLTTVNQ